MERTDLDAIGVKLNEVYDRAISCSQFGSALDAIKGLMELHEMRTGHTPKGIGFGTDD